MQVFNGDQFSKEALEELKKQVVSFVECGVNPSIVSLVFIDDPASKLYTRLKVKAAKQVGINFRVFEFNLNDDFGKIKTAIEWANLDKLATGVMIQKPSKHVWEVCRAKTRSKGGTDNFANWWQNLVALIDPAKDVDGLSVATKQAITDNIWQQQGLVLPATVGAVLKILAQAQFQPQAKILIIGRSDIFGYPLYQVLKHRGLAVELIGRVGLAAKLQSSKLLSEYDVVISATGQPQLINGAWLKNGVVAIDVGEPRGDFDFPSVSQKARLITPVPGGVGPVTVFTLLENCLSLAKQAKNG